VRIGGIEGFGTQAGNLWIDDRTLFNSPLTIAPILAAVHLDVNVPVARRRPSMWRRAGHVPISLAANRVIIAAGLQRFSR
jgi:hypothetical protein